jgi:hypothetical protein
MRNEINPPPVEPSESASSPHKPPAARPAHPLHARGEHDENVDRVVRREVAEPASQSVQSEGTVYDTDSIQFSPWPAVLVAAIVLLIALLGFGMFFRLF